MIVTVEGLQTLRSNSRGSLFDRQTKRAWNRSQIEKHQVCLLNQLLATVLPHNRFYRQKFGTDHLPLNSLAEWRGLPTTSKDELHAHEDSAGLAAHHTWSTEQYQRWHRTSGTKGHPLTILDTAEDWEAWIEVWQFTLDAAELQESDRVFMAFSFGPFIGFWSAHDACLARGALVIPGGGLSTEARLELILASNTTVVCCTPTYALHLAKTAERLHLDLPNSSVRALIVAGEPGGSHPVIRQSIEQSWGANLIDHAGATEVGPWGFGTQDGTGLHVIESHFISEFLPPENPDAAAYANQHGLSELVITSLCRYGAPVLRYRSGDLVKPVWKSDGACNFVCLEGGILGRADDMVIVRGVNVFPNSVDQVLRSIPSVHDYRLTIDRRDNYDQLLLEVEDSEHGPDRIATILQSRLGLRFDVIDIPIGTLTWTDGKARRFVDRRSGRSHERR